PELIFLHRNNHLPNQSRTAGFMLLKHAILAKKWTVLTGGRLQSRVLSKTFPNWSRERNSFLETANPSQDGGAKLWVRRGPRRSQEDRQASERRIVMRRFAQQLVNFVKREDGPTAVEYAVMLALIIVVCITAISPLGKNANGTFDFVATKVSSSGS